ncbi:MULTISPECIES: hypothetical protein [Rhodococcus]|uniref:hypothetical protein n=1 Tax=Rhodococcus TaxID=1827 RepID=UPI001ED8C7D7|nr:MULTISPECIES: hypothetical protein [Rhodococcus]
MFALLGEDPTGSPRLAAVHLATRLYLGGAVDERGLTFTGDRESHLRAHLLQLCCIPVNIAENCGSGSATATVRVYCGFTLQPQSGHEKQDIVDM